MGLLDVLAAELRCDYLSDLRQIPRKNKTLRRTVVKLPLNGFPVCEWIDAADYLCGIKTTDAQAARTELLRF